MRSRSILLTVLTCALFLLAPLVPARVSAQAQDSGAAVAAAGLINPRGFTWDGNGRLIVAQAGTGGDAESSGDVDVAPPEGPYTGGKTASVVGIDNGCPVTVAGNLPSAASATGEIIGVAAVAYLGDTLYALVSGGGAAHGNPDQPNGIYAIDTSGGASLLVDLGTWLRANPVASPPDTDFDPEGSFYSMVSDGKTLWVVESNSEQLLSVGIEGTVTRVTDFSAKNQVPTALALAPDGGVYVGELTSAPFPNGGANVFHVAPDGSVTTVWSNLTTVTGLAVGPDGTLYASQLSETRDRAPYLQPGTGSIVRQTGESTAEVVASSLNFPIALGFGPDGQLYVASPAIGASEGTGAIVRFTPGKEAQSLEPSDLPRPSCGDASAGSGTSGSQPDGNTELVVRIYDYGFDNQNMTIPVGYTVVWANTGAVEHATTAIVDGKTIWDSGLIEPGGNFSFTFTEPGTYNYVCSQHPEMTGTITVQ